ncbi:hypothetical protein HMPREF9445_01757 [Bacteroides clarus YIT 12056]|uniref:Uncharacterized protein n=1 Tax=Bacteroides clarus YIT 12056 TaxID=762984 RepID=A0ABP2KQZ6_9BACE|nr:hypothetical protein HMPREF9445_01757 [Bacteroides clarus YIT 12056]
MTAHFATKPYYRKKMTGSTTLAETEPANTKRKEINPSSFFMCL